jgi:septal ring-binding cell division protein DamX
VHTPIISEAPKTQENVKTLPVDNVAIVSTANPKESVLPQQPTENISLNTISKSQEKEQQTNITISKEPQKPTISEKESIKIPQQEKTNIYENNEWLRAKTYFENNNLTDAAKIWKNYIKKSPLSFTIQVELACQNETISEAYNSIANKNKFYIIPKTYKGKQCYIIGYGIFNERNEAQSNLKELPDLLLQQKFPPRVVYASEMIK